MQRFIFDMEVYQNYTLLLLKKLNEDVYYKFELFNDARSSQSAYVFLKDIVENSYLIGFNCQSYDQIILKAFLDLSYTNRNIYNVSTDIIVNRKMPWEFLFNHNITFNLIDLIKISPAIKCGLKVQGARINANSIQDLPYHPSDFITNIKRNELIKYCKNDLLITEKLYNHLVPQVKLREHIKEIYNDGSVLCKSDPQIAETLLLNECGYSQKNKPRNIDPDILDYKFPKWLSFKTKRNENTDLNVFVDKLKNALSQFVYAKDFNFKDTITLDGMQYQFGIGGLHSQESSRSCVATDSNKLFEVDVTSLYPSIIINEQIYPESIGFEFLNVYQRFYNERLIAKRSGDKVKSDMLKLVLNGTFGKFDNKYSSIYSTNCLLRTTLTGQLALLMLIDMLGNAGIKVVSANTDSVTIFTDKDASSVLSGWEKLTNLNLERTDYLALYSHSVNNYIAITNESYKSKGCYVKGSLRNNFKGDIIIDAVVNFLKDNTPLMDTLKKGNIRSYLFIGYSKEGIIWNEKNYGKCIRYVLSTSGKCAYINKNKKDGSSCKLPNADSIYVLDALDAIPNDCAIDLKAYENKCLKILNEIGYGKETRKKMCNVFKQFELDFN